jgi:hypothetical protein
LQWITINDMQKIPSWEANSCSATHSIPCLLHNTSVHYYFPHTLTHTLSPNSFSPPPFFSHTYSSLNNITIMAHIAIINGNYIYQLQISHNQAVNVKSIKGNHIRVAYTRFKLISGRYLGLTYKDTWMLLIKKWIQYKRHCIKLTIKSYN